jgi:Rieske Fe-S protein
VRSEKPERRALLKGAAGLAVAWMAPNGGAAQEPRTLRPTTGDLLVRIGDAATTPLTPADIAAGATPTLAWPMAAAERIVRSGSRLNRIVLIRVDSAALGERTLARAAEGVVAYSAVCTHTGCEVGAFLAGEQALYCDCHQSKFNALDDGRVLDGPAPRLLPALPLRVNDGRLEVAGPFTARPGFEQG